MNRIVLNETSYFGAGCRSVIAVEAAVVDSRKLSL